MYDHELIINFINANFHESYTKKYQSVATGKRGRGILSIRSYI